MARAKPRAKTASTKRKTDRTTAARGPVARLLRLFWRGVGGVFLFMLLVVLLFALVDPPRTFYMRSEASRLGKINYEWVDIDEVSPVVARSVVAAEDANYCLHWGFDMQAIRAALDKGAQRGASTISQQVVKNVFLWHGRSWLRKALEAAITPLVEAIWSKRRILEVYLNVAEFDEGVFGVKAAAARYFRVEPDQITEVQAARLAAVLPDPKGRNAGKPTSWLRKRAASILDGAETIRRDGRAECFEPG